MSKFSCEVHEVENGYLIIEKTAIGYESKEYVAKTIAELGHTVSDLAANALPDVPGQAYDA